MTKDPAEFLAAAARKEKTWERTLYVLAALTEVLKPQHITPFLVGGSALEFYTFGGYATGDIDLVAEERHVVGQALEKLGFEHKPGFRHWYHKVLDISIEIPDTVLAGAEDKATVVDVQGTPVRIIAPEDLLIDRLAAYKFWQSTRDGDWAARLFAIHGESMDLGYLRQRAQNEKVGDVLDEIISRAKQLKDRLGILAEPGGF